MLSKRLETTLHRKKYYSMLSQDSWDNIAQVKSLRTAAREHPDNIAQGKKLLMLSQYSWDNIAQVNYLCNVVQEA